MSKPLPLDNNGDVRAAVNPAYGAAISSLQWRRNGHWHELLYRPGYAGGDDGWRGQAPWLWPAVGRHFTPEQLAAEDSPQQARLRIDGKDYPLPRHGFAMDSGWKAVEARPDRVRCRLTDGEETRRVYPFPFAAEIETALLPDGVRARFTVTNPGDRPLPFAVGNHLTLALPLPDGSEEADARLETAAKAEFRRVTPVGFEGAPLPTRPDGMPLTDPLAENAIIAGFTGPEAALTVAGRACRVTVTQHSDDLAAAGLGPDAYRFVLWADRKKRFFCPEPWLGVPNAVNTGQHRATLAPGATFAWEMTIRLSG